MEEKRSKLIPLALLEQLANEIFVEILSYLNGIDAVFAFSQLNHRFQSLLCEYCQVFDFKSTSKQKFDLVLQRHDTQQCKSLQLSNDEHTPRQIEYFIKNYSLIEHFPQLESLSILKLKDVYRSHSIFHQLQFLPNLHSLIIESICRTTISHFDLPKVKRLVVSSCKDTKWILDLSQVETVEYTLVNCCSCQTDLLWPFTLKRLKILFEKDVNITLVQQSLRHLLQLTTLEIYEKERGKSLPNGEDWENLIRTSLPLLQIFKFYFQFEYLSSDLNRIVGLFSTPFYVLEKNWFIRCDVSYTHHGRAVLYSLPFAFEKFTTFRSYFGKIITTLPNSYLNDFYPNIYSNLKTLEIDNKYAEPEKDFKRTKIVNLIINVDFVSTKWLDVLTKLRHLSFKSDAILSSENFCNLFDNAPHLYSLTVEIYTLRRFTDHWKDTSVCNHLSDKIRWLEFYSNKTLSQCLNESDLDYIVQIFVSKCQHLSLSIRSNIDSVGFILRCMKQLLSLHVHIMEGAHPRITLKWLDQQQTEYNDSNCIIAKKERDYYFWLGKYT